MNRLLTAIAMLGLGASSWAAGPASSWEGLSGEAYVEQRLACEQALFAAPAASFDREGVREKILRELRVTAGLKAEHGWELTPGAIASEVARTQRGTRDPAALRSLHKVLWDDPLAFAECVARPTVVHSALGIYAVESAKGNAELEAKHEEGIRRGRDWHNFAHTIAVAKPSLDTTESRLLAGAPSCLHDSWRVLKRVDDFIGRSSATSVWTGSEVIVWGGANAFGDGTLGQGFRYRPATDTWSPIYMIGGPSERSLAQAAWSGTEMLMWGGAGPTRLIGGQMIEPGFREGWRYSPTSDRWTRMSTHGQPAGVIRFAMAWTGSALIVAGGRPINSGGSIVYPDPQGDPLNGAVQSGAKYLPQTDT